MGNCCPCFKEPEPRSQSDIGPVPSDKNKEELLELRGMLSEDAPVVVQQINSNGNSKAVGSDNCGSLKRAFYPRIQRLAPEPAVKNREPSEAKLNALFESYKDTCEDAITSDGIERLCSDLQVSPDEFRVLVLAWKLNARQMCRFSRTEFMSGCRDMRVDSIRGIQAKLPEIELELAKEAELFKDLYRFTFRFGLEAEQGQRILPQDVAVCLWRLVFTLWEPPILVRWLDFLEQHPHVRGIPKDTWNMFLNFSESVGSDLSLSAYDDTEAWPSLFDDFVEFENDKTNQNISKEEVCREDYN